MTRVGTRLNNKLVYEHDDVGVFEHGLDPNLFVQVFALGRSGFVSQKNHFAGFNGTILIVDSFIDSACGAGEP